MGSFQAVRGMNDILPPQSSLWRSTELAAAQILNSYGYEELRLPLLEHATLFEQSVGSTSDIVQKEMYTFTDRSDHILCLRPEGTAGCVRACIQHNLLRQLPLRLWYSGPMFRYERPQKGRQRQFYQLGIECYGPSAVDSEVEIIAICERLWRLLDIRQQLKLEINTLGGSDARNGYREALQNYLNQYVDDLSEIEQQRLHTNPLRILDSKNEKTRQILFDAPTIMDYLTDQDKENFAQLQAILERLNIVYQHNPLLVRGLDYYNHSVFEWTLLSDQSQNAVCAGGRYDNLVEQLGGASVAAVGCAMGMERLTTLIEEQQGGTSMEQSNVDVYFTLVSETLLPQAFEWAENFRRQLPTLRLVLHCGGGRLKNQLKKADKMGATIALIFGDEEYAQQSIILKPLRGSQRTEEQLSLLDLPKKLATLFDCPLHP